MDIKRLWAEAKTKSEWQKAMGTVPWWYQPMVALEESVRKIFPWPLILLFLMLLTWALFVAVGIFLWRLFT